MAGPTLPMAGIPMQSRLEQLGRVLGCLLACLLAGVLTGKVRMGRSAVHRGGADRRGAVLSLPQLPLSDVDGRRARVGLRLRRLRGRGAALARLRPGGWSCSSKRSAMHGGA